MRALVSLTPGFSDRLAGWEATLIVSARGSARSHWIEAGIMQERSTSRYAFGLTDVAFLRFLHLLREIPERFQQYEIDHAPVRRIRLLHDGAQLERKRCVFGPAVGDELRFDAIWGELYELVRPALIKIGTPDDIVRHHVRHGSSNSE